MVLFPAMPVLGAEVGRPSRRGTIPDSVDGDDSESGEVPVGGGIHEVDDPACGGGSRAGGCECSCGIELGHLNGKVQRLEDFVRLLVAYAGLARW